jgi:hypothetical protein
LKLLSTTLGIQGEARWLIYFRKQLNFDIFLSLLNQKIKKCRKSNRWIHQLYLRGTKAKLASCNELKYLGTTKKEEAISLWKIVACHITEARLKTMVNGG